MAVDLTPSPLPAAFVERPLAASDLDAVMAVELRAYAYPWSRGNFSDSLVAGHRLVGLFDAAGGLLAYEVSMAGVDERHLLNLTVAPEFQGRGLARHLLDRLVGHAAATGAAGIWLEVRQSNQRARQLYERYGFATVGTRRGYYPNRQSRREDAVVMSLDLRLR
jgi:[ribosomal protein S18]-alanine N-acetyltransferase